MRAAFVVLLLLALATPAFARDYYVAVPQGWEEQPETILGPQLDKLRALKGTRALEAVVYLSPDHSTQLAIMRWTMEVPSVTRFGITQLDLGIAKGTANVVKHHVSDSRGFEGNRLVGHSVDENDGVVILQSRIIHVDANKLVQMLSVACTAAGDAAALNDCRAAQRSMDFKVANAIDIPDQAEDGENASYRLGQLVGFIVALVLVIWGARRLGRRFWR